MLKQKLWNAFTWYYRTCFWLIDRGLQEEKDRRDNLTDAEKRAWSERRRHSRRKHRWAPYILGAFYCCVPMLLGVLTQALTDLPRVEWVFSWMIVFWIYYVFVAWCDQPK